MHFTNKFILKNENKYEKEDIPVVLRFHQEKENINFAEPTNWAVNVYSLTMTSGLVQLELLPTSDYVFEMVDRLLIPLYH
jgi:hypothetical protein